MKFLNKIPHFVLLGVNAYNTYFLFASSDVDMNTAKWKFYAMIVGFALITECVICTSFLLGKE